MKAEVELIRESGVFDALWYVNEYPDVLAVGIDPIEHYLWIGARLMRNPGPDFDTAYYLEANHDVKEDGVNPLLHYVMYGRAEGRPPVPGLAPAPQELEPRIAIEPYQAWIEINRPTETGERRLRSALAALEQPPLVSVVMPVYRPPLALLAEAVDSVLTQIYSSWELCIHVDGDHDPQLISWLRALEENEPRVVLSVGDENGGISVATNAAASLASGEFIAFFDQDDLLTPNALAQVALAAASDPQADLLYSDDDKIGEEGARYAPQFKPGWAPVLLMSYMYMSHLLVVRRELFQALGGFRVGFEGSQDYDFALRAAEKTRSVVHIPEVLYHWRAIAGSTATSGEAKPHSFVAGLQAVQEACDRRGIDAVASQPDWAVKAKVGMFSLRFGDTGPLVSIIVPTRNRLDLLQPCIESIERRTTYRNYEIIIVDNESDDPDTLAFMESTGHRILRLASPNGQFSFANLMNRAVEAAGGRYVLLLNNDTVVRNETWLSQMVGYAQMPGVGAVGAKLYFPDDTIQHAGIIHGLYGDLAGPAFRNIAGYSHGYLGYTMVAREYSAVTAACLLTGRDTYLRLGGLDEQSFAVAYNDVDFCYRLVEAGHTCIYCPDAELTHYEGKSRGFDDNPLELANFRRLYRNFTDRWYNPNLTVDNESFSVRPWKFSPPAAVRAPLRVAMFSHNLNHEGAPNSMFELVTGLKAKGYIEPVVLAPADGPLHAHYQRAEVPVHVIDHPLRDVFEPAAYAERLRALGGALRQSGAELVYANTADAFWAVNAAAAAELPAVWNIRESVPWQTQYEPLPEFLRARALDAFHSAYRVVFVAQSTRELWAPLAGRHNFAVVPNGLDLERLQGRCEGLSRAHARERLGLSDGEIAVVLVGTVCERKNQRALLAAVAEMPASLSERVRVFIVGDRESDYSLLMHGDRDKLPAEWREKVDIVPETDQPYLYFLAGDIAVCASVSESYPRVVLEAMALGLPLVTTPVFGITEQARERVNALFFDPHDSGELREALTMLIEDDSLRRQLADNSKRLFAGLMQYDDMLDRYAQFMREAAFSSVPVLEESA